MNLNINSVNYSANIGQTNVNLTQNAANQTQIIVPANMTPGEAGLSLLAHLSEGDKFTGEITNITQNQITIALSDTVTLNATLADALNYNIGDVATFSVKQSNKDQIVLKSEVNEMTKNLMNDQTIQNALRNAGLPINETTASLVQNMMKYELPINADNLNKYAKMLANVPNATPEDVVLLNKMDIPVTEENVTALHDYYDYNEGMTGKAEDLSNNFLSLIQNLPTSVSQATISILNNFVNAFSEPISTPEKIPISFEIEETVENENGEKITQNKTLDFGETTAKEFFEKLTKEFTEGKISANDLKQIVDSKEFKHITENFVRQEMFINPEDVSKENIKKLYAKIVNDTNNVAEKFSGIKQAENMLDTNQQIRQNVDFLNQANQFMNFVQIPLKMAGQNAHGDLYVYKKSKSSIENKEELTALLHLDMDNLGPMDVFVRLKNKNVTTNFKVATDDILSYIEAHIDELNTRLNALGYNVTANVTSDKSDYSFKKSVIDEEIPPVEIKRFSFDVRA